VVRSHAERATPQERYAVIYLIVGLDRTTLAAWHENIQARDVTAATRLARARAQARGIDLVVAAVIGPNLSVLPHPAGEPRRPGSRRWPDSQPTRPRLDPGRIAGTLGADPFWASAMTQQYIVGQFSLLLAELQPTPREWAAAVDDMRRRVERTPPRMLHELAPEAMDLADVICWAALERGDVSAFCRYAKTAGALREFTAAAGLLLPDLP
jgi:hypothetical protein